MSNYSAHTSVTLSSSANNTDSNAYETTLSPYWLPDGIYLSRVIGTAVPCFGFTFNVIVFFTMVRVKNLLPPLAKLLMCHQSFIDGMNSIFFIIVLLPLAPSLPHDTGGLIMCVIYVKMVFATDAVGQWNNFIISLERFYAICFPLRTAIFTKKRIWVVMIANWVFCGTLCYGMGFLYVKLQPNGYCGQDPNSVQFTPIYGMLYMVLFYLIPMLTMPVCYAKMVRVINKSAKSIKSTTDNKAEAATRRLIVTLIIASIFLVVTNMPDMIFFMFMYCIFGLNTMSSYTWTYMVQVVAKSLGPVVNPIIYSFAIPKFRYAVKDAFCGC